MKLYIKQKVFSIGDKYNILDENGNRVFYATGKVFSFGAKISLMDYMDEEQYYIKQKLLTFFPEYHIFKNDYQYATIKKQISFFKPKITVESDFDSYSISGDFFAMDFTVHRNGQLVGSISKKWLSWGDSYELEIFDENDPAFFCSLVIAIDNCLHNQNSNNNNI